MKKMIYAGSQTRYSIEPDGRVYTSDGKLIISRKVGENNIPVVCLWLSDGHGGVCKKCVSVSKLIHENFMLYGTSANIVCLDDIETW